MEKKRRFRAPPLSERFIRKYALHLALHIRRRGKLLVLWEHHPPRRKIGEFRSFAAVERAIKRHGDFLCTREGEKWMRVSHKAQMATRVK
jgi:hypothetical protein